MDIYGVGIPTRGEHHSTMPTLLVAADVIQYQLVERRVNKYYGASIVLDTGHKWGWAHAYTVRSVNKFHGVSTTLMLTMSGTELMHTW